MAETKTTRKKTTRRSPRKSDSPTTLKSFNPRTGEVMREIPANSPAEVADIVANARKVAPEWGAVGASWAAMLREPLIAFTGIALIFRVIRARNSTSTPPQQASLGLPFKETGT